MNASHPIRKKEREERQGIGMKRFYKIVALLLSVVILFSRLNSSVAGGRPGITPGRCVPGPGGRRRPGPPKVHVDMVNKFLLVH